MKILLKITQRPNFDNLRKHENNYTEKESDIEHVNHQFASQDASKTGATIYIIIFLNNSTYYQSEQKMYPPSNCCKKKKKKIPKQKAQSKTNIRNSNLFLPISYHFFKVSTRIFPFRTHNVQINIVLQMP